MNEVFRVLEKLNIQYKFVNHEPVYTVEEAEVVKTQISGVGCKNLFLKHKENYYLYVLQDDKKADLKLLSKKLDIGRLSFGSEEELNLKLKLKKGSVTPLGIINDNKSVILILDKDLRGKKVLVHPSINTCTVSMDYDDLIKYIEYFGNNYYEL